MEGQRIPFDLILRKLAEDAEKAEGRAKKSQELLLGQLNTEIAASPYDVVYEEDRVKLKHYKPMPTRERAISSRLTEVFGKDIRLKTPLLVIYALINREPMVDLQPERSVVQN